MLYFNLLHSISSKRIGTLSWATNVIEFLIQEKANVKFLVTNESGLNRFLQELGVKENQIIVLKIKNNLFRHLLIQYYLFKFSIDGNYLFTPYVGGLFINFFIKQIIVIHDLAWFNDNEKYTFFRRLLLKLSTQLLVLNSFKIITVSDWSKLDIEQTLKINIDAVIPNTITDPVNKANKAMSTKLFIKNFPNLYHKKFVLSIGTVQNGKNYLRTAKIFENTLSKQGFKYIIVGDYDEKSVLVKSIKARCKNTILTGYISDSTMFYLLKNCTGYVNISFYEGFGIPLLDAIFFEKPSLISNNTALIDLALSHHEKVNPFDEKEIEHGFYNFLNKTANKQESTDILNKYSHSNVNQLISIFFSNNNINLK